MRLDKFLSAARIFKSRTLAEQAISASMVYVDGLRAKSSKEVKPGSIIEVDTLTFYKKIEVKEIPSKNLPRNRARELYLTLQERAKS
ncbi:MAG: RNA-binding S4 domain-containing protein [Candidatus Zixiibacteriota bacterium]|nr:MAG: RNA-binding S4 domain-containing protein [candidate division Zixibacteria bacterium]